MTLIQFDPYVINRRRNKYENNIRFAFSATLNMFDQKRDQIFKTKQLWGALNHPPSCIHSKFQIKAK